MPNGTVWFARPNTYPTNVRNCSHAPGRPNLNGFISVFRAESLDAALDGKIEQLPMTYELAGAATRVGKLSPTGNSTICFNWEDLNLWVDKRGHLHTFHHGTIDASPNRLIAKSRHFSKASCYRSLDGQPDRPASAQLQQREARPFLSGTRRARLLCRVRPPVHWPDCLC